MLKAIALGVLLLTACAGTSPSASTRAPGGEPAAATAPAKPLVGLFGKEPASVAVRAFVSQGTSLGSTFRVFNALLTLSDAHGVAQPELLESLPTLNTN